MPVQIGGESVRRESTGGPNDIILPVTPATKKGTALRDIFMVRELCGGSTRLTRSSKAPKLDPPGAFNLRQAGYVSRTE